MTWDLEQVSKVLGGGTILTGGGFLVKHFVLSAPDAFKARREDAATLLQSLRDEVAGLKKELAEVRVMLEDVANKNNHLTRERDALFLHHDAARDELLDAAAMLATNEKPGAVLLGRWRNIPTSDTILARLKDEKSVVVEVKPLGSTT